MPSKYGFETPKERKQKEEQQRQQQARERAQKLAAEQAAAAAAEAAARPAEQALQACAARINAKLRDICRDYVQAAGQRVHSILLNKWYVPDVKVIQVQYSVSYGAYDDSGYEWRDSNKLCGFRQVPIKRKTGEVFYWYVYTKAGISLQRELKGLVLESEFPDSSFTHFLNVQLSYDSPSQKFTIDAYRWIINVSYYQFETSIREARSNVNTQLSAVLRRELDLYGKL